MSEHTKEPWKLFEARDARPHRIYAGSHLICELHHSGYLDLTMGKLQLANANRIVKCVNALNGIGNPAVWRAQMGYMDSDHSLSLDIIQVLRKQNDYLLKVLKENQKSLGDIIYLTAEYGIEKKAQKIYDDNAKLIAEIDHSLTMEKL